MAPISTSAVLRKINKHRPEDVAALRALGIGVKYIGDGAFRIAYRILGTDLVIKFPIEEGSEGDRSGGIAHTRAEARRIARLSETVLRAHVPKVYYVDDKNGVIVMKFYEKSRTSARAHHFGQMLAKVVRKHLHINLRDLGHNNIRRTKDGWRTIGIMTDLGY